MHTTPKQKHVGFKMLTCFIHIQRSECSIMVQYIRADASANTVFDINDTHVGFYNNFLNPKDLKYMQESKNRTGEIVWMTPEEYYEACGKVFNKSAEDLKYERSSNSKAILKYTMDMLNGDVFPLPYVNFADHSQEGLHRMMAAGDAFGWDEEFPVLVVTPFDNDRYEYANKLEAMREFERFDFKQVAETAAEELSNWDTEPPPDVLTQLKEKIEQTALSEFGVGITVDVECKEESNSIRVYVYLTEYDGVEEERNAYSTVRLWLDDMFDLSDPSFEASDYY